MESDEARTPGSDTSERSRPPLPPKPPRPQISLMIPPMTSPPRPMSYYYDPRLMAVPMTPEAVPMPMPLGMVNAAYPAKASEFMFKQFEGFHDFTMNTAKSGLSVGEKFSFCFRDFTMNTAKSGLSVGEKFSFWAYNKLRAWSRRWFTHIFLLLVIAAYSLAGAAIFVAVERPAAQRTLLDAAKFNSHLEQVKLVDAINKTLEALGVDVHGELAGLKLAEIGQQINRFEHLIVENIEAYKRPNWTYWEAVFYCGTVFTTIGQ